MNKDEYRELKLDITRDVLSSFLGENNLIDSLKGETSSGKHATKLIVNRLNESNVYSTLSKELRACDEFIFNVAFITDAGLVMLKQALLDIRKRNVKGKIITSDYLSFNNPKVFKELLKIQNDDVRVKIFAKDNFHAKGYIFRRGLEYRVLIGSSNLTDGALKQNTEWNVLTSSYENGLFIREILDEVNKEWNEDCIDLTDSWIEEYSRVYETNKPFIENKQYQKSLKITPNKMQREALGNLESLRENHQTKALLISATGTGKTYLSAFDAYNFKPKKVLFIAHREKLLNDAKETFEKVFGSISSTIFKGGHKEFDKDFVFASIQTLTKDNNLTQFSPSEFDYMVIDEAHHSSSNSYLKVLNYFKPKFLLGMTATPERNDDGDIFGLFDHNIAYEIRLQDALNYDLLCPFHYFGVNDFTVDEKTTDEKLFNSLVSDKRVELVKEKAEYFGNSGDKVKGLIFVSRIKEAFELSNKFNQKGWKTAVVSGEDSDEEKEHKIELLESGNLNYLISVDVLNEGVDIPEVNQIIMLRPTNSAIVFIQQLGRGLRKTDNKEYVNVIDFIANYKNNYLIPIALSGDKSYQKENYRHFINEAPVLTPGTTTIEFDEIVKEEIFKSINTNNISNNKVILNEYKNLRKMLGRIPDYDDYLAYDTIDLNSIINTDTKYYSYHMFLLKNEPDYKTYFNDDEIDYLNYISIEFLNGKRMNELEYIEKILDGKPLETKMTLRDECAFKYLNSSFMQDTERKRYHNKKILKEGSYINPNETFVKCLKDENFVSEIRKIISYARKNNEIKYKNTYDGTDLVLYSRYTRKDVCRLLNWNQNENGQNIGGYKYDSISNTMAVYVTYNKDLNNTKKELMYEDRFIDNSQIVCMSKNKRTLDSPEIVRLKKQAENNMKVHLFINKIKGETDFYYLGEVKYKNAIQTKTVDDVNIVEIYYDLETPVKDEIYNYLTTKIEDEKLDSQR